MNRKRNKTYVVLYYTQNVIESMGNDFNIWIRYNDNNVSLVDHGFKLCNKLYVFIVEKGVRIKDVESYITHRHNKPQRQILFN